MKELLSPTHWYKIDHMLLIPRFEHTDPQLPLHSRFEEEIVLGNGYR